MEMGMLSRRSYTVQLGRSQRFLVGFLLCLSTTSPTYAIPPRGAIPTITLGPTQTSTPNVTQLLERYLLQDASLELNGSEHHQNKRQSGVIGTGICATAMQGFTCGPENHESYRCAGDGDDYSYCICAGSASLPGRNPQGLWLNTAWGPGCYACYDKPRGYEFDGTCNGNGNGRRGQCISDILATLTITITEWTYSTVSPTQTRTRTRWPPDDGDNDDDGYPPNDPATTTTRIVTVTNTSNTLRRLSLAKAKARLMALLLGSLTLCLF